MLYTLIKSQNNSLELPEHSKLKVPQTGTKTSQKPHFSTSPRQALEALSRWAALWLAPPRQALRPSSRWARLKPKTSLTETLSPRQGLQGLSRWASWFRLKCPENSYFVPNFQNPRYTKTPTTKAHQNMIKTPDKTQNQYSYILLTLKHTNNYLNTIKSKIKSPKTHELVTPQTHT